MHRRERPRLDSFGWELVYALAVVGIIAILVIWLAG